MTERRSHRTSWRTRESGFSLVELLAVLLVIGLALGMGLPAFLRERVRSHDMQALREITSLVDVARFEALNRHTQTALHFDEAARTVRVFEDLDADGVFDSAEPVLRLVPVDAELRFGRPDSGDAIAVATGDVLRWTSDGSLLPGLLAIGTVPAVHLQDQAGNSFRLRFNGVTGMARIEKWNGSAWTARQGEWKW